MDRRQLLTLLALGTAASVTGCARIPAATTATGPLPRPEPQPGGLHALRPPTPVHTELPPTQASTAGVDEATADATAEATSGYPYLDPAVVLFELPPAAKAQRKIALTVDDGYSHDTVAAYVQFAQDSGTHLTFSPNGVYGPIWEKHAAVLRPLIEAGQVQIGNHTFDHKDVKLLSPSAYEEQLEKNEAWVQKTFGTTTRPWFRPPYGFRDERTDAFAASLGWSNILMWNGTFGDSSLLTPKVLMQQARMWLNPGTIMLGHANHPTVDGLYPEIVALLRERQLTPVTLNEAFSPG